MIRKLAKSFFFFSLAILIINSSLTDCFANNNEAREDFIKIVKRNALESEARKLERQGRFDAAILKFREAIRPELINTEAEKGVSLGHIIKIQQLQGKYEEALQGIKWHLGMAPDKDSYIWIKRELEAYLAWQKTGSPEPIYKFISDLRAAYQNFLPPKQVHAMFEWPIVEVIKAYDALNDYDRGIFFMDEIIACLKATRKTKFDPSKHKIDADFVKIRQGFIDDQKNGTRGSATQAIIQSDCFPW